jgi:1-deoxy-D-xylulose-5-phosphate reductoisomerase
MKKIAILGSTGSIGTQTLDIVRRSNGEIRVTGLAAGTNLVLIRQQIKEFSPALVSVQRYDDAVLLQAEFPEVSVLHGEAGLLAVATGDSEVVLVAIVGVAALRPTIEAIKLKKDIALASKEILVAAGALVMDLVKQHGVKMLPVDSEHSAIMQSCLPRVERGAFVYPSAEIEKLILTASGGAFRDTDPLELPKKKSKDALKHPNWSMGKKITIDSATLMNKGLEVIEAHWLFGLPYEKIDVVIHPQSIIHSLVEYIDGSIVAQLGLPDMRLPIQYALFYPDRQKADWHKLKLTDLEKLTFKKPDRKNFRALDLAYNAGRTGGTLPAVLNAANEEAVGLFLEDKLNFMDISVVVEKAMGAHSCIGQPDLEQIIGADLWAREYVRQHH